MPITINRKPVNESKRRAQVRSYFEHRLESLGRNPAFTNRNTVEEVTNVFYSSGRWYGDYMIFEDVNGGCGPFIGVAQISVSLKELKDALNKTTAF